MRFALFFLVWLITLSAALYYVGRRLIKSSRLARKRKLFAWVLIVLWLIIPSVTFLLTILGRQSQTIDILSWAGYGLIALFSIVFTLVLVRDLLIVIGKGLVALGGGVARIFQHPLMKLRSHSGNDPKEKNGEAPSAAGRREFLVQATNLGILSASAPLLGYGIYEARRRADIEQVFVPIAELPPELEGFRIVQFSDLHAGPTIKRPYVERLVEQIDDLKADLIVFTGDLVDGSVAHLRDDVAPLRELTTDHEVYFVTGNHEYYSGVLPWLEEADRLGFTVLINEHMVLQRGKARFVLAGVTDYGAGSFIALHESDPRKALAGAPIGLVKVLLAHQPKSIYEAEPAGATLQLSGHTHGGQFFPWDHLARLAQPYIKGLHKHGSAWVYVSRGVGYWGPPVRLGIPPEISVITLKASLA